VAVEGVPNSFTLWHKPPVPRSSESTQSPAQKAVSKGCGTLFFSVFAILGLALSGVLLVSFYQTVRPYFWMATPCTIIESRRDSDTLERTSTSDGPVIRYRYEAGGATHESGRLDFGMKESLDSKKIDRLLYKYPIDSNATCYVNPKNPAEVALRRGPLWPIVFVAIPLVFVAVGVGGIVGVWKKGTIGGGARRTTRTKNLGPVGMIFFFGMFALAGGALGYFLVVRPLQKYFAAKNWPETPCEIISSSVGSHSGSKGSTTYSVDITYRYQVGGREYQSDTYSLMSGSSSGRGSKEAAVARYPVGSKAVCYVNPEDPTDTLLNRELTWWLLLGLLPLAFLAVGVIGLFNIARTALKKSGMALGGPTLPGIPTLPSAAVAAPTMPGGPVVLKADASPLVKLAGAMFIALFWNGITGVFVGFAVNSFLNARPEWFLTIFITPFVLIGIGLLVLVGSTFLNLFNPRMQLTVNSTTIPLGGTLEASWGFTGSSSRVQRFKLTLEGREETTQGHGKNRRTNTKVLVSLPLTDTADPRQIGQGRATVEIPGDQKPSQNEENPKVVWKLKAAGEIPRFPDFEEEYEITIVAREVH
jgi:hypothetical protein